LFHDDDDRSVRSARLTLLLTVLVVLAGCGGSPASGGDTTPETPTPMPAPTGAEPTTPAPTVTPDRDGFTDPETDRLGWEAGYWYDEPLPVNASDGLNNNERAAVVARTMARIERIRGLEFESSVPVEVVDREAYRAGEEVTATAWDEQVWEALLVIGEDRSVERVFESFYGASVQGSYVPSENRIVVVSEADRPTLDRRTVAHELVHALQDQHFGFDRNASRSRDERLARQALIEGDAGYVAERYEERCEAAWSCLPRPDDGPGAGLDGDMGVYVATYQPYSDGPALIHRLRERGGWAAVDAAYDAPPTTTSQVIHPDRYPEWSAQRVRIEDRSAANWSRFDRSPPGTTVGEASVFALLHANGGVAPFHLQRPTRPYRRYNYTHATSTGWAGDKLVPYRSVEGEYGYVFRTEWETTGDAAAFAIAYRELLRERWGAERREGNVLVVSSGSYADAFRVRRSGTTVTVTNAPTAADLESVHGD
jgi:hypothetical protein